MKCLKCGEIISVNSVKSDFQYDGNGTYIYCSYCNDKKYLKEDSSYES